MRLGVDERGVTELVGITELVSGMNKVAFANGHVDRQFALDKLPRVMRTQCKKRFRLERAGDVLAMSK